MLQIYFGSMTSTSPFIFSSLSLFFLVFFTISESYAFFFSKSKILSNSLFFISCSKPIRSFRTFFDALRLSFKAFVFAYIVPCLTVQFRLLFFSYVTFELPFATQLSWRCLIFFIATFICDFFLSLQRYSSFCSLILSKLLISLWCEGISLGNYDFFFTPVFVHLISYFEAFVTFISNFLLFSCRVSTNQVRFGCTTCGFREHVSSNMKQFPPAISFSFEG